MALSVSKRREEVVRSTVGPVTVLAEVSRGELVQIRLVGVRDEPVWFRDVDVHRLSCLRDACEEVLGEVFASITRTAVGGRDAELED